MAAEAGGPPMRGKQGLRYEHFDRGDVEVLEDEEDGFAAQPLAVLRLAGGRTARYRLNR